MKLGVTRRLIVVAAVVVTVFIVLTGVGLVATSTTAFCSLCHIHEANVEAYKVSSHRDVNCEQCHTRPGPFFFITAKMEALQQPVKQLSGDYEEPILGTVQNQACRRCHTDETLFATLSRGGIKVNHEHLIEAGYLCMRCHSTVAHLDAVPPGSRTYPVMDQCLVCHNNNYTAPDGTVALSRCDLCHATQPPGAKPNTHTTDWIQIHGFQGILSTCSACHVQPDACSRCHNGVVMPHGPAWLKQHGRTSERLGSDACTTMCHTEKNYCQQCHQYPMPHPADWIGRHDDAATRAGAEGCFNCHAVENCQTCHQQHGEGRPPAHELLKPAKPEPTYAPSPTETPTAAT